MANFKSHKNDVLLTTFTMHLTTTSPRITIQKHRGNRETPCKNAPSTTQIFFRKDRRIETWESAGKTLWTAFGAMI
jgi:hypothetical protein